MYLRTISRGKGVDSTLINNEGHYQVVGPDSGQLLGKSHYLPSSSEERGVEETKLNGDSILVAYVWLKETPWALVIRQPLRVAYAQMYRTRRVLIASTAVFERKER